MRLFKAAAALAFVAASFSALAAEFPAPKQSEWTVRDFKFHTGEVLPELRIAYTTVGEPTGEPALPVVPCSTTTGSPVGSPTVV